MHAFISSIKIIKKRDFSFALQIATTDKKKTPEQEEDDNDEEK